MTVYRTCLMLLAIAGSLSLAGTARAENEGQADLDKAMELKLTAENIGDLSKVISLCDSALKAGLDPSNTDFAQKLVAGTLLQRAEVVASQILESVKPPPTWPQLRQLAIEDLERSIKVDPNQANAHYLIARLHSLPGGDKDRARKAVAEAVRLASDEPVLKAKSLVLQAALSKDPNERQADFDEAVKLAPHKIEILRARGLFLLMQNKLDRALADFDAGLAVAPEDAELHAARGATLFLQGKYDDAKKSLDKATQLDPDLAEPYTNRARIYAIQGKSDDALAELDRAEKIEPDAPAFLLLRARVQHQAGHTDKALADVDRVLQHWPGLPQAVQLHAALQAGTGKFDKAIADLEGLKKNEPKDAELLFQLAIYYYADNKPEKAIEALTQLLAEDNKSAMAHRARADAYLKINKHAEAVADYEAALKIEPKDSGALNNLAWVLATSPEEKLRNGKRAIELAKLACDVTEYKQAHILSTLAASYAETGDFDTAIEWSKKAVELGTEKLKPQLNKELQSYQSHKPWRELHPDDDDVPDDSGDDASADMPAPAEHHARAGDKE